jgi:hypothetical protein
MSDDCPVEAELERRKKEIVKLLAVALSQGDHKTAEALAREFWHIDCRLLRLRQVA